MTRGYLGYGRWPAYVVSLATGDIQQISVHGRVLTHAFTRIPVTARLLHNVVLFYVHVAFLYVFLKLKPR